MTPGIVNRSTISTDRSTLQEKPVMEVYSDDQSNTLRCLSAGDSSFYGRSHTQYTMQPGAIPVRPQGDHLQGDSNTSDLKFSASESNNPIADCTNDEPQQNHDSVAASNQNREPANLARASDYHGDDSPPDSEEEDYESDSAQIRASGDFKASNGVFLPKPFNKKNLKRHRLSHSETRFLLNEFVNNPHPDAIQRGKLAKQVSGLTSRQIQVWFQNRRAKLKRMSGPDAERLLSSRSYPEGYGPAGFNSSSSVVVNREVSSSSPYMQPVEGVYASQMSHAAVNREEVVYNTSRTMPQILQTQYGHVNNDGYSPPNATDSPRRESYLQNSMPSQPVYTAYVGMNHVQDQSQASISHPNSPMPNLGPYSVHPRRGSLVGFSSHPMGYVRPQINSLYAPRSVSYTEHEQVSPSHVRQSFNQSRPGEQKSNSESMLDSEQQVPSPSAVYNNAHQYYTSMSAPLPGPNFAEMRRSIEGAPQAIGETQGQAPPQSHGFHGYYSHAGFLPPLSMHSTSLATCRDPRYMYLNTEKYAKHIKGEAEKAHANYIREKELQKHQHEAMQPNYQRQQEAQLE